jgi:hypothetical protein
LSGDIITSGTSTNQQKCPESKEKKEEKEDYLKVKIASMKYLEFVFTKININKKEKIKMYW